MSKGHQLISVEWKCSCGHLQQSIVTTIPYLKDGEETPTYSVNCMECFQVAEVSVLAKVEQTEMYDNEEDFEK